MMNIKIRKEKKSKFMIRSEKDAHDEDASIRQMKHMSNSLDAALRRLPPQQV